MTPPWKTGDTDLPDEIYNDLVPMDGFPKGTSGSPRLYNYRDRYWVVITSPDFGDILIEQWGHLAYRRANDDD